MKKFIGTKLVYATPAWRIDGQVYLKDSVVPTSINREDGYKVVYEDGYESWSPKDVFEKAYRIAETALDRARIEHENLIAKIRKLQKALDNEVLSSHHHFLEAQLTCMTQYARILEMRCGMMQHGDDTQDPNIKCMGNVTFGVAVEMLRNGQLVRRNSWAPGVYVVKQVPAHIPGTIIPTMQSLPPAAKQKLMDTTQFIKYMDQCLIIDTNVGHADSWHPNIVDVFATDWEIVTM